MFLNCHTYFSFKYGSLSITELFDEAKRCGISKLMLTDINNTSAYIELMRVCEERKSEYELDVSVGIEFRTDNELQYIGIARNNAGFEKLNRYLSYCNSKKIPPRNAAPDITDAVFIYPTSNIQPTLKENEYIGLKIKDLNKIFNTKQRKILQKSVILHPVTFKDRTTFNIHRLLRVIDQNTLLSKLDPATQADENEIMMMEAALKQHFIQYPEVIRNTETVMAECQVSFELGTDKNIRNLKGSKNEDFQYLKTIAREGYEKRYAGMINDVTEERFRRELDIIARKDFEAYYLISHDIVQYAKNNDFSYVGRGSGANSIISYCLEITDVDPIDLDLYFERFLNPSRTSPPDFDMDFSWKDRDAVYEYIFRRYNNRSRSSGHVALLGTHTTFKARSAIRELGKVFGLPKEEIDRLVKDGYSDKDHITGLIMQYAHRMQGIPSHLSIHAGGVLITEKPVFHYTATDHPPKDLPTAHLEMHNAEDMGIYKFDVLSQRGLGHIHDTKKIIARNRNNEQVSVDDFHLLKDDDNIRTLLSTGHTMGCFYVESPAMRMLLGKLQCQDYRTLVAASSIIRPGVAKSGMMRAYIERHHMKLRGDYYESIHPKMDELMDETHGVMVYQEDVIKVAHHFADITLTDADILRRGMSGKFRSRAEFQRLEETFFDNCKRLGYEERVSKRVWYEIESFSGYSFSKGHSASYAVESYQSLYLKAYYPLEFMVGVINNFGGFYKTEFYFHEARMYGATLLPPCINKSEYLTHIENTTIYVGFIHLKSLEKNLGDIIPKERAANGPYKSLDNFIRRVPIGLEQIRILIKVGAFRFLEKSKKTLLWEAQLYFGGKKIVRSTGELFDIAPTQFKLPVFTDNQLEDAFDQLEFIGFPLCNPYILLDEEEEEKYIDRKRRIAARELMAKLDKYVNITGYLVTTKDTYTQGGHRMHFGTFHDKEGEVFDTVHFPDTVHKYPFRGRGFYIMSGKVVEDFGYPMIEISFMKKLPMRPVRIIAQKKG
ncbi:MAG: DNA polymerase III subunit alpha [Cyclobacteriaceae bacterium]